MIKWLRGKEKITAKIVDIGFDSNSKPMAIIHIEDGNLYNLLEYFKKNGNKIDLTFKIPNKPEGKK